MLAAPTGSHGLHPGAGLPRTARAAAPSPKSLGQRPSLPNGLRQRQLGGFTCRTLDSGAWELDHSASSPNGSDSDGPGAGVRQAAGVVGASDTFKQLRLAVLSSLDFSEAAEQPPDWEDSAYESSAEEIVSEGPGQSVAAVGKAVYETLRLDTFGKTRRVYVRRRDLIRAHGLQPRDLRRIDPSLGPTKTSPSLAIKDGCVLLNIGGVRAVLTAERCLLFEPTSPSSRKFVEVVTPRLHASAAERARKSSGSMDGYPGSSASDGYEPSIFPFELEILEGALMVATGKHEAELVAATRRVGAVLQKLPKEITPVNLEELRRVKQLLVELESKSENLRDLLEELMDDEEEMQELNLSSRPVREEKRRQRERERLEREMEREWWAERGSRSADAASSSLADASEAAAAAGARGGVAAAAPVQLTDPVLPPKPAAALLPQDAPLHSSSGRGEALETWRLVKPGGGPIGNAARRARRSRDRGETPRNAGNDDGEDGYEAAQDALEELIEEEEEERELEEVEDLLEYYLQRAATTQSEAERLLAGARDLEESIGVSLSARRFEVNRLELLLSIASFAAALGAMVASIFGMNLRSTLEMSVIGFWSTTAMIVAGSCWIFWVLYKYTKRKRIL